VLLFPTFVQHLGLGALVLVACLNAADRRHSPGVVDRRGGKCVHMYVVCVCMCVCVCARAYACMCMCVFEGSAVNLITLVCPISRSRSSSPSTMSDSSVKHGVVAASQRRPPRVVDKKGMYDVSVCVCDGCMRACMLSHVCKCAFEGSAVKLTFSRVPNI